MQDLKVLCIQSDIVTNDPEKNRELFELNDFVFVYTANIH